MHRLLAAIIVILAAWAPGRASALEIFACDPTLGALAQEIGGDKVTIFNAITAKQDPHFIEARPSLIAAARRADLLVCMGADQEAGWLPLVVRQSANARIQQGAPGYFLAAPLVRLLEVPARVDRAEGDIHPMGNPHILGDPGNLLPIAVALSQRLARIDGANAAHYTSRAEAFGVRWKAQVEGWRERARPLAGVGVVVQHRLWSYLIRWLGMLEVATIEPKPGVPPGAAYLADLIAEAPKRGARLILLGAYENPSLPRSVSERIGLPLVALPYTVGGAPEASDLTSLYTLTIDRLVAAASKAP